MVLSIPLIARQLRSFAWFDLQTTDRIRRFVRSAGDERPDYRVHSGREGQTGRDRRDGESVFQLPYNPWRLEQPPVLEARPNLDRVNEDQRLIAIWLDNQGSRSCLNSGRFGPTPSLRKNHRAPPLIPGVQRTRLGMINNGRQKTNNRRMPASRRDGTIIFHPGSTPPRYVQRYVGTDLGHLVLPFLIAVAARGTEQNGYVRRCDQGARHG
jgi:hypothetical protein